MHPDLVLHCRPTPRCVYDHLLEIHLEYAWGYLECVGYSEYEVLCMCGIPLEGDVVLLQSNAE